MSERGSGYRVVLGGLSALGLLISVYLSWLHADLLYGSGIKDALCDVGSFKCSTVNTAPEAEFLKIPQSVLGGATYLLLGILSWVLPKRPELLAPLGGIALLTVLYSGYLAYVSASVIGAWCLFCMALYVINLGLFGTSVAASGKGLAGLVGDAFAFPSKHSGLTGAVFAGLIVSLGAWQGGYLAWKAHTVQALTEAVLATPTPVEKPPVKPGESTGGETKKVRVAEGRVKLELPSGLPFIGPENAPVTIVELSDFQCPFCKRLAGNLHQLVEEYPKEVRLVFLNFPLNLECTAAPLEKTMHPDACGAAAAGVCAQEQGDFWMMHDRLFEKQSELKRRTYLNIAEELGLDKAKFEACLENPATMAKVKTQTEVGAKNNVTGTPVFFINGRQMSGAQPIEVLRAVVEAELAGNKGLLDLSVQVGAESIGTVEGQGSVTVAGVKIDAFEAAIEEGKAVSRAGSEPTRGVSWFQAKAACEAAGKRLCTEKEWLSACTGQTPKDEDGNGIYSDDTILGRRYGYGDYRRSGACADSRNPEAPGDLRTGIHPQCGTPEGVYDMTGGVKEWVGLTPGTAALKGGSFSSGDSARCGYFRDDYAPMAEDPSNGFRCCEGPAELPPVRAGREAGEKLSDFTVPLLDGGSFKLADIKGKPAVLTFWASWCGPCKKELPILSALYQKYKAQGLMVAGISVDSDEGAIRRYLTASPLPFLIAWDKDSALMGQFTSRGVPTSIWVDKTGLIRLRTTGVPPSGEKRLEELVAELLGTQAL